MVWYVKIKEKIDELYVPSKDDPEMLERKYSINLVTHEKLLDIADRILAQVAVSPAYVGYLIFDPL